MHQIVRPPKGLLALAAAGSVLMTFFCLKFWLFPKPGDTVDTPEEIALLLSFFGFFAVLLPAYLAAECLRTFVEWRDDRLIRQGMWKQRSVEWNSVRRIRWVGPRVVLSGDGFTFPITLEEFPADTESRLAAIIHLRELVPVDQQTGWNVFCLTHVVSLIRPDRHDPDLDVFQTRKSLTVRYLKVLIAMIPVGIGLAFLLNNWWCLLTPLAVIPAWGFLYADCPPEGRWNRPIRNQPVFANLFLGTAILAAIACVGLVLNQLFPHTWFASVWFAATVSVLVLIVFFFGILPKSAKLHNQQMQTGIPQALAEWDAYLKKR